MVAFRHTTLTLRITRRLSGEFPLRVRGWLCEVEYTKCKRNLVSGDEPDQQGHGVDVVNAILN